MKSNNKCPISVKSYFSVHFSELLMAAEVTQLLYQLLTGSFIEEGGLLHHYKPPLIRWYSEGKIYWYLIQEMLVTFINLNKKKKFYPDLN